MGTSYKMRCKHCGTEFLHMQGGGYGVVSNCAGSDCYIELEQSIRCPHCMRRLNYTEDGFRSQIVAELSWL